MSEYVILYNSRRKKLQVTKNYEGWTWNSPILSVVEYVAIPRHEGRLKSWKKAREMLRYLRDHPAFLEAYMNGDRFSPEAKVFLDRFKGE